MFANHDFYNYEALIESNNYTELENKFNNYLLRNNKIVLTDLFLLCIKKKNSKLIDFFLSFNYLFLLPKSINYLDLSEFKRIFQINEYYNYIKKSKKYNFDITPIKDLFSNVLFYNKSDIYLFLYTSFNNTIFPKKNSYYTRKHINDIERLIYFIPFIYKNKGVIKYILQNNKRILNDNFIKNIVNVDNNTAELLLFIFSLDNEVNLPMSKFKIKVKKHLIRNGKKELLNVLNCSFTFDELLTIIKSNKFNDDFLITCIKNIGDLSLLQKNKICFNLLSHGIVYLCVDLYSELIISNQDYLSIIIKLQSFKKLDYFIKTSNFDVKNNNLYIDKNLLHINLKFSQLIIKNYGYQHIKFLSSIVYSMSKKKLVNNLDKLLTVYNIQNDLNLLINVINMGCEINVICKLIKNNVYMPNNIFLYVLDVLMLSYCEDTDLDTLVILSYLTQNNYKQCFIGKDSLREIGLLIDNLLYYGRDTVVLYLKTFIKNSLLLDKGNSIKSSGFFFCDKGRILSSDDISTDELCVICQDNFTLSQDIFQLNCKHLFHNNCIHEHFIYNSMCPLCGFYVIDLEI